MRPAHDHLVSEIADGIVHERASERDCGDAQQIASAERCKAEADGASPGMIWAATCSVAEAATAP